MIEPTHDAQLLRQFVRDKDEHAFETLVNRHAALVWGVCQRAALRHEDAEDAFQSTFLIFALKAGSIRKSNSVPAWLHRTAVRVAHRIGTEMPQSSTGDPMTNCFDLLTEIMHRESLSAMDDELQALPDLYRDVLVPFHLEGRTRQDIARHLGVSEPAVKARLTRGRSLLRVRLARRGVALPLLFPLAVASPPASAMNIANRFGVSATLSQCVLGAAAPLSMVSKCSTYVLEVGGKIGLVAGSVFVGLIAIWSFSDSLNAGNESIPHESHLTTRRGVGEPLETTFVETIAVETNTILPVNFEEQNGTQPEPTTSLKFEPETSLQQFLHSNQIAFQIEGVPLADFISYFSSKYNIKIQLAEGELTEVGLQLDQDIQFDASSPLPMDEGLSRILGTQNLGYVVENDALRILPLEEAFVDFGEERLSSIPQFIQTEQARDSLAGIERILAARKRKVEVATSKHTTTIVTPPAPTIELIGDKVMFLGSNIDYARYHMLLSRIERANNGNYSKLK